MAQWSVLGQADWGYSNPRFRQLYDDTLAALRSQGTELPHPNSTFPQTEAALTEIIQSQEPIDATSVEDALDGELALFIEESGDDKDRVVYAGRITKEVIGDDATLAFRDRLHKRSKAKFEATPGQKLILFAPTDARGNYQGLRLNFAHFTPDTDHYCCCWSGRFRSACRC